MIYYHFNIPTVGPFRWADTHIRGALFITIYNTVSAGARHKAPLEGLHVSLLDIIFLIIEINHSYSSTPSCDLTIACMLDKV